MGISTILNLILFTQSYPRIMKYKFLIISLFLSVFVRSDIAFSKKKEETNRWANHPIKIDGKIDDWNDSLVSYNNDTKFYYTISNNNENLYLAIKSTNSADVRRIFAGGISFLINTEGKKKSGYKITFPVAERKRIPNPKSKNPANDPVLPDIKELRKMLSQIKEIKAEGFKTIIDGGISLYNTYGIQAAVTFNDQDNLIYELAIPLSLLNLYADNPVLLAYNIKINGLLRPQMQGGGMPDGRNTMQGRSNNGAFNNTNRPDNYTETMKLFSSTDFWIKSRLAKKE